MRPSTDPRHQSARRGEKEKPGHEFHPRTGPSAIPPRKYDTTNIVIVLRPKFASRLDFGSNIGPTGFRCSKSLHSGLLLSLGFRSWRWIGGSLTVVPLRHSVTLECSRLRSP